ncbi:phage tail assembly protein [Variovorax sp. PAMC26660]|uniref:phage tail assembly protein n=1 Tax=Variovorax sp. PAMC26660 TaxID=2762322 RepID=UPI00164E9E7C|nr:phage tail assembly protein [Variovorax sp. PAMC26660]QNK65762.1 phage tail assembly protein [Variovorax sp. PAMC26660]
MEQDEITITLRKPVKLGDMTYEKLELREPTAGELEKASSATTNMGVVINLIQLVAKVPRKVVEGLCQRDLKEAGDFLEAFSEGDQTTGETSSQT